MMKLFAVSAICATILLLIQIVSAADGSESIPTIIEDLMPRPPKTLLGKEGGPSTIRTGGGGGGTQNRFGFDPDLALSENPDIGFLSAKLAAEKYCAADYKKLCRSQIRAEQNEKSQKKSSSSFPDPLSASPLPRHTPSSSSSSSLVEPKATECLEEKERLLSSNLCHAFISSRRACLDDMTKIAECSELKPAVALTDRFRHRRIKMDARRERLELRKMMEGAGDVSLVDIGRGNSKQQQLLQKQKLTSTTTSSSSESQSEAEIRAQQQQQMSSASPSMTVSSDEEFMDEHFLRLKQRYEKDMAEAKKSAAKNDHFMTVCAALLLPERDEDDDSTPSVPSSINGISESCLTGIVGKDHLFNMNGTALMQMKRLAARKRKMHRQNEGRYERDLKQQKKLLMQLKERSMRHHLDRLDMEISTGEAKDVPEQDLAHLPGSRSAGFLIRERKERERRRRLHRREAQNQFAKRQQQQQQDGDAGDDDEKVLPEKSPSHS